jgi:hypothetical protein
LRANGIGAGPARLAKHRPMLAWRLDCPVCGVNCITGVCSHRESFVADVEVDQVVEAALAVLDTACPAENRQARNLLGVTTGSDSARIRRHSNLQASGAAEALSSIAARADASPGCL